MFFLRHILRFLKVFSFLFVLVVIVHIKMFLRNLVILACLSIVKSGAPKADEKLWVGECLRRVCCGLYCSTRPPSGLHWENLWPQSSLWESLALSSQSGQISPLNLLVSCLEGLGLTASDPGAEGKRAEAGGWGPRSYLLCKYFLLCLHSPVHRLFLSPQGINFQFSARVGRAGITCSDW